MLMLVSVFALASCGDDPCADGHVDANGDEICDNCEASVPKQEPEQPEQPELPEEPEREPTYKITFNFHGVVYENQVIEEGEDKGKPVLDDSGRPIRVGKEKDISVYVLDVLQNQAPTEEQLAEIPAITYGGITVVGWYDSPELENEVDFTQVLTADKNVYAKLKIDETNSKGDGYCGDDATWKVTSKGVLKIDGEGAMYDFTYPELAPWYFNEDGTRRQITGIEVGKKITHIGSYSFYNLGISQVSEIELGEGVVSLGNYAFAYSTLLKTVPLTDTIQVIGRSAFEGCKNFTSINIPDSVTTIEGYAFYACTNFEYIILGTGIKTIGEYAFNQQTGTKHAYTYYRGTAEQYANVVIQLGNPRFDSYGAYLYFYVESDPGVAGQYWTYDEKNFPKYLSYTVRYMTDGNAFPLLTDFVYIAADKTGTFTAANKTAMESISYRGYKFETWNTNIDAYMNGTAKLKGHITFNSVRGLVVGDNATYDYNAPSYTLTIKGSGSTWDFEGAGDTVYYQSMITKVVFDPGITRLGANLLAGINSLVAIEIPETVTEVDPRAFSGCTRLAAIYYMGSDLSKCKGLDSLVEIKADVYAKGGADSTGKNGAFWQDKADGSRLAWSYADGVLTVGGADQMPDFAKGEKAPWADYTNVKELKFASNVKKIGAYAFADMKSIEKLTIHANLVNIPRSAFEGSGYWNNEANWEKGALMAGAHLLAFDASKIPAGETFATIPQATKVITADAFKDCGNVTALVLPVVIDSIDATAFDGLTGLQIIYYYGQNVNMWNALPDAVDALTARGVKVLYRAQKLPAENPENYWRMVSRVPTVWSNEG